MNILYLLLIFTSLLNASTYLSKVEPYRYLKVKTQVAGIVTYSNKQKEFTHIRNNTKVISLETKEENISLKNMKQSLTIQNEILKIHQKNFKKKQKSIITILVHKMKTTSFF